MAKHLVCKEHDLSSVQTRTFSILHPCVMMRVGGEVLISRLTKHSMNKTNLTDIFHNPSWCYSCCSTTTSAKVINQIYASLLLKGGTEPFLNAKNVSYTNLENAATISLTVSQPQELFANTAQPRSASNTFFIYSSITPSFLTRPRYKASIYITHTSACVICYSSFNF